MDIRSLHIPTPVLSRRTPVADGQVSVGQTVGTSRPPRPLALGNLGIHQVQFSKIQFGNQAITQEKLDELNEQLNDINTYVRLSALKKLYDLPELKDTRVLRTLGRYVFYNDAYQPLGSPRVQGRLWAIKVLEKHANYWGIEGLFNNLREIGNSAIAAYATSALGKSLPVAPEWLAQRYRARLYDWMISENSGKAPDLAVKLLANIGPAKDANYLWFLMNQAQILGEDNNPSWGGSSSTTPVRVRLSKAIAGVMTRNLTPDKACEFFKNVFDQYLPLMDKNPGSNKELKNQKRLLESALNYLPDYFEVNPPQSEAEAQKAFDLTLQVFNKLGATDVLDSNGKKNYPAALSKLGLKLTGEARKGAIRQLMETAYTQAKEQELVTSLFELMLDGKFNRKEIQEDYLTKKYNPPYDGFYDRDNSAKERWLTGFKTWIQQWRANQNTPNVLFSYKPIITEALEIFGASNYVRRTEKPTMNADSFRFIPQEAASMTTTEGMFGFKMEEPADRDWSSKFPPPKEPPKEWELEPFSESNGQQQADLYMTLSGQFKTTLAAGNANRTQELMYRTLQIWMDQKSRAAYDVLKENLASPPVFELFLSLMWRMSDQVLEQVPRKQLLSLIRSVAPQNPMVSENQGFLYRNLFYELAITHPEMSGELLTTALDVLASTPDNSPTINHAAKMVFTLLKFGVPDFVLKDHKDTLKRMLTQLNEYYTLQSSSYRKDLDWAFFSNNTWESESNNDSLNMDQKKNFDLAMQLALKLNDTSMVQQGVVGLNNYYSRVRNSAYADEIFIIRFLRNPKVVEAGLNIEAEASFQTFREMLTWYKAFEAVPAMIKRASQGPLQTTSWLMGAITGMDLYAIPELEKILQTSMASAKERDLAKEALGMIFEPKRPYEMFTPFPYALPPLGKATNNTPSNPTTGTPSQVPTRPAEQIGFPGLFPTTGNTGANPPENPITPINPENPPVVTEQEAPQIRFPGLVIKLKDGPDEDNRNLSYLQLIDRALSMSRSQNGEEKTQALADLVFFANQFLEVAASGRTNLAFVTPEKTAVANNIAEALSQAQTQAERKAYLGALLSLQEPATMERLAQYARTESDPALQETAVLILGNLGRTGARTVLAEILNNETRPMSLRQQAAQALIRLDDRDTLLALAANAQAPIELRQIGVQAIGGLRIDSPEAKAIALNALGTAPAGSALKATAVASLGQMADNDDLEVITAIINSAPESETTAVKIAAINALTFLDYTDAAREFVSRLRQDNNYDVSRTATQFMASRAR